MSGCLPGFNGLNGRPLLSRSCLLSAPPFIDSHVRQETDLLHVHVHHHSAVALIVAEKGPHSHAHVVSRREAFDGSLLLACL